MKKQLYDYQEHGISAVLQKFKDGSKRVVFQLATGGGKTITASELIHRVFVKNPQKNIIFFVHRVELLSQFKRTFENQYSIEVGIVDRTTKLLRWDLNVHVAMIETAVRRLKNNANFFDKTSMIIIDECHNGTFDKIFEYFPNTYTVGLTATPTRISKKHPMRLIYDDIVTSITIQELIEKKTLSPNKTYSIKSDVNYSQINKTGGDYSTGAIFNEYSKSKHIQNVVNVYEQISKCKKTIIFNASVEHSELVNAAFCNLGYNSKHLDGATNENERENILKWFVNTPNAILQNVGVLTAGFDEPSIITVIMNRPTTSLALWLQCTGRGSRVYAGKPFFNIIDLGGNVQRLGDWSFDHNWEAIFKHAEFQDAESLGVAPVKDCPKCYYIMSINTMQCQECGHQFIKEIEENTEEIELQLVADNFSQKINVHKITKFVENRGWKEYAGIHIIKDEMIKQLKIEKITEKNSKFDVLFNIYQHEVSKWCNLNGKKFNNFHKKLSEKILNESIVNQKILSL